MNDKLENGRFLRIKELYAFIAIGDSGEGVMGMKVGNEWLPMIGADLELVNQLKKIADKMGIPYKIKYFVEREHL